MKYFSDKYNFQNKEKRKDWFDGMWYATMSVSKQKCLKVLQSLQNPNRSHYFKISNIDKCVSVAVPTDKSLLIYVSLNDVSSISPALFLCDRPTSNFTFHDSMTVIEM